MSLLEVILIAVGLSMDAFAVSMCRGLEMRKFNLKHALIIALAFGFAQAIMPLLGYYLAVGFSEYVTSFDHFIAFILLGIIGGKMIYDSLTEKEEESEEKQEKLNVKQLFLMAIATSIDALAIGISFAFLEDSLNIFISVSLIGGITFILSVIGVFLGFKVGSKFKNKATFVGGLVLILIGLKILLEHLGVIHF